ncbi:MAG: aminotransferase class I/II-fold pyridoxal phosphate-dependent enzyme [Pseudomonadota bacterium]
MYQAKEIDCLRRALKRLSGANPNLPGFATEPDWGRIEAVLDTVAERMQDNYPYHHPLYAGQMLKPPHPIARLAYALSLWVNPNNHALDGGRASSAMEKELIPRLSAMWGWEECLGHLTGGGTMANLEALWVAGQLHPGRSLLGSSQAHYTHSRICSVLGLDYASIETDTEGRMDLGELEAALASGSVGTVVVTMGNTGLGAVDPLPEILVLRERYDFRVHADAAYGGYFGLSSKLADRTRRAFDSLNAADSIVIDPHKHGLQPYGCGSIMFRDPSVGRFYKHGSPYTYFSSADLHLGEISLECSRPGAAAVALWATMQLLPPEPRGEFAGMLDDCLDAARSLHAALASSPSFSPVHTPELDIVVYAATAAATSEASKLAREVFEAAADKDLHLALIELPVAMVADALPDSTRDSDSVTCLRSTLMKPEHAAWIDEIVSRLETARNSV